MVYHICHPRRLKLRWKFQIKDVSWISVFFHATRTPRMLWIYFHISHIIAVLNCIIVQVCHFVIILTVTMRIFRCFAVFQFSLWTFIRKFIESFMFAVNFLLFTLIFILNERKHTANKRKLMVNFFLCRLFFTYFVSETENNWNLHCGKNDDIFKNIICFWFVSMICFAPPRI